MRIVNDSMVPWSFCGWDPKLPVWRYGGFGSSLPKSVLTLGYSPEPFVQVIPGRTDLEVLLPLHHEMGEENRSVGIEFLREWQKPNEQQTFVSQWWWTLSMRVRKWSSGRIDLGIRTKEIGIDWIELPVDDEESQ